MTAITGLRRPRPSRPRYPKHRQPAADPPVPTLRLGRRLRGRTLGEAVPVTGTPFTLHYASDRTPGYREAYTLHVPVQDINQGRVRSRSSDPPGSRWRAGPWTRALCPTTPPITPSPGTARTPTAGRSRAARPPPPPCRIPTRPTTSFHRLSAPVSARRAAPASPPRSRPGPDGGAGDDLYSADRQLGREAPGTGGWTLSVLHGLRPDDKTLYLGDGSSRTAEMMSTVITTWPGTAPRAFPAMGAPPREQSWMACVASGWVRTAACTQWQ